jgi:hypothetical protein
MLSECLDVSSIHLGVPFTTPRQLGAVEDQQGRLSLLSVEWRTGQPGARLPSKSGTCDHCSSGLIGSPDTVRCTPDSPVHQLTVGAVHVSREDCAADRCSGDRWLTGQSSAPPDSPVNYSHVAPMLFPRVTSSPRTSLAHRTLSGAPPDNPVHHQTVQCVKPS